MTMTRCLSTPFAVAPVVSTTTCRLRRTQLYKQCLARGNRMHGSRRRGLETEHLAMVTAVKRPTGETRGKVAAGPHAGPMPPRQSPTLQPAMLPWRFRKIGAHEQDMR